MSGDREWPDADALREDRRSGGLWLGAILIGIGALLLVGQVVPGAGRYVVLAIGIVLLAIFVATRSYGVLIPGGIVTGVGVGILLTEAYPSAGGLFLLSLAGGFAAIWLIGSLFRLRENHWWPLVPAAVLGTIGLVALADQSGQFGEALRLAWPIALVVLGVLIVARASTRRRRRSL